MRAIITGSQPAHCQQGYIRVNRVASASPINSFAFPGLRREWEWEGRGGGERRRMCTSKHRTVSASGGVMLVLE